MKRIIILGGGGFGREIFQYIKSDIATGSLHGYSFAGVIDENPKCELVESDPSVVYLGKLAEYKPVGDETVTVAIGRTTTREKIYGAIEALSIPLFTYIHPTAIIASDVILGEGSIICPNTVINAGARIGKNVAINVFCSVGHSANIGRHSVLSPYCSLSGDSVLEEKCFLGTRATLFPGVRMGKGCVVDAHTAVKKTVGDGKMVSMRGNYLVLDNRLNC